MVGATNLSRIDYYIITNIHLALNYLDHKIIYGNLASWPGPSRENTATLVVRGALAVVNTARSLVPLRKLEHSLPVGSPLFR